ncbi:MAG: PAS domain S-box protein [Oceanicaulis sp.]|jgi:two-component system sensor kinase FixL|nr:PAS domain S-box protein [Oceanicaulis sp.]
MSDTDPSKGENPADLFRRQRDLILMASGDGIYGIDDRGISTFVNPAAARMSGYSVEEMLGRNLHELVHHSHADGRHFPSVECPIHEATRDGKIHRIYDDVFWRKDGTSFPVEYVSTPIWDDGRIAGAVVSFRDITERKRAEQELRDSEQRYRAMFDGSNAAGFLIDAETCFVLDENKRTCELFGYSEAQLRLLRAEDLFVGAPGEIPAFWRKVQREGAAETETPFAVTAEGERIPVRLSASRIRYANRTGLLVLATDLSVRREIEARAWALQSELHHVSRVSAMGEMASAMAHELNQPLSAVMNYLAAARRLSRTEFDGESRTIQMVEKAISQASRAGEIIRSLRTFLDKGESETEFASPYDVIHDTLPLIEPAVAAAGLSLSCELDPDAPHTLLQRVNIQQVLLNLIRNAAEAMGEQAQGVINVACWSSNDQIWVEVADQGPGLSQAQQAKLFQPFNTSKSDGMGVGLSICHSIISDHDGEICAENRPDGGAVFRFCLPVITPGDRA